MRIVTSQRYDLRCLRTSENRWAGLCTGSKLTERDALLSGNSDNCTEGQSGWNWMRLPGYSYAQLSLSLNYCLVLDHLFPYSLSLWMKDTIMSKKKFSHSAALEQGDLQPSHSRPLIGSEFATPSWSSGGQSSPAVPLRSPPPRGVLPLNRKLNASAHLSEVLQQRGSGFFFFFL